MSILIVTWTGENTSVPLVTEHLQRAGHEVIRLDTDLYPMRVGVTTSYGASGRRQVLRTAQGAVDLATVTAVWYRRFRAGTALPADMGDTREAALAETRQTLWGTIAALDCFQLDPLPAVRKADYKELQTRLAIALGLEVPRTIFTNEPSEVRAFFDAAGGSIVTKMQSQFAIYREGNENVVFTSRVKKEDLAHLSGLRYCPMIFQEMIPKALELRAIVVGENVFTASIDPRLSMRADVDWRRDGIGLIDLWERFELPEAVRRPLVALTAAFGLRYAAADFIVTPEGRIVFLEINAAGEWFWLQERPGLPIAEHIAALLDEKARCGDA